MHIYDLFEAQEDVFLSFLELLDDAQSRKEYIGSAIHRHIQGIALTEVELGRFGSFGLCEDLYLPGTGPTSGFQISVFQEFDSRTVIFSKTNEDFGIDDSLLVSKLIDQKSFPHIKVGIEAAFLEYLRTTCPLTFSAIRIGKLEDKFGYEYHETAIDDFKVRAFKQDGTFDRHMVGAINPILIPMYGGDREQIISNIQSFFDSDQPIKSSEKSLWQRTSMVLGFFQAKQIGCLADLKLLPGEACDPDSGDYLEIRAESKILMDKAWPLLQQGNAEPRALAEAATYFKQAAILCNHDAQNNIGLLHKIGTGVTQSIPRALYWLTKAARQGNVLAEANLGLTYLERNRDSQRIDDLAQAAYYLERAATKGNEVASQNFEVAKRLIELDEPFESICYTESRIESMIQHLKEHGTLPPVLPPNGSSAKFHDWLQHDWLQ